MSSTSIHRSVVRHLRVSAPPERVFPLLCPVREHDWVEGWRAEVLHSTSGFAADGCVFSAFGATWIVTRYEPPQRIEFAIFDGDLAHTLRIHVTPTDMGTDMKWERAYTSVTGAGGAWVEANVPDAVAAKLGHIEEMMARYLASP